MNMCLQWSTYFFNWFCQVNVNLECWTNIICTDEYRLHLIRAKSKYNWYPFHTNNQCWCKRDVTPMLKPFSATATSPGQIFLFYLVVEGLLLTWPQRYLWKYKEMKEEKKTFAATCSTVTGHGSAFFQQCSTLEVWELGAAAHICLLTFKLLYLLAPVRDYDWLWL